MAERRWLTKTARLIAGDENAEVDFPMGCFAPRDNRCRAGRIFERRESKTFCKAFTFRRTTDSCLSARRAAVAIDFHIGAQVLTRGKLVEVSASTPGQ